MLPNIEINPGTFLRQHCTLPALPEVINEIQNMLQDHDVEIDKVGELLSVDPALVAQLLKVVNSAYYGLPREISKIPLAIAFLGLNEVYRTVLSLSVIKTLAVDELEVHGFWLHSFHFSIPRGL